MSDISREIQQFATARDAEEAEFVARRAAEEAEEAERAAIDASPLVECGVIFIKVTMHNGDIETWIDIDYIVVVEQLDGFTRLRCHSGETFNVTERAETILAKMEAHVVNPEV